MKKRRLLVLALPLASPGTPTRTTPNAGFAGENSFRADAEFTLFYLGPVRILGTLGGLPPREPARGRARRQDAALLGEADILAIGAPGQAPKAKPGSCGS